MLLPALFAIGLVLPGGCAASVRSQTDSLDRLFLQGRPFPEFLKAVRSRRDTWLENTDAARVDPALLERARAVPGSWRLLVVAEDWCGDSANTIPYLARLVDSLPEISLRIVTSAQGRWVMERFRTTDDRAATPTIVLLNQSGEPAGCFVERPAALRSALSALEGRSRETVIAEWRRQDGGRSTIQDIVEMLESAGQGVFRCPGPS